MRKITRIRILSVSVGYGDAEKTKRSFAHVSIMLKRLSDGECHCNLFVGDKKANHTEGLVDGSASLDPSYSFIF